MKYVFLCLAILLEILGSSLLKVSDGFTKIIPTTVSIIAYILCLYFLSLSLRSIPLGVAYAIWAGLGLVATAIVSVVVFKQSLDMPAVLGMIFILSGIIIMNGFSKAAH